MYKTIQTFDTLIIKKLKSIIIEALGIGYHLLKMKRILLYCLLGFALLFCSTKSVFAYYPQDITITSSSYDATAHTWSFTYTGTDMTGGWSGGIIDNSTSSWYARWSGGINCDSSSCTATQSNWLSAFYNDCTGQTNLQVIIDGIPFASQAVTCAILSNGSPTPTPTPNPITNFNFIISNPSYNSVAHTITFNYASPIPLPSSPETIGIQDDPFINWYSRWAGGISCDSSSCTVGSGGFLPEFYKSCTGLTSLKVVVSWNTGYMNGYSQNVSCHFLENNQPPSINPISNATLNEGDTYSAAGLFTDPDSTSWTATVDYGDGSGIQPLTLSGMNFSLNHQYAVSGTYTVTVSVTNNQGATGTTIAIITVNDVPPVITFHFIPNGSNGWFTSSPATGTVSATTLSAGSTTVSSVTCTGVSMSNLSGLGTQNVSGTLSVSAQGSTTVSCKATDNLGAQTTQQVIVKLDSTPPTCTAVANPSKIWPPNKKLVNVSETVTPSDTVSGLSSNPFILQSVTNTDTITNTDYPGFTIGTPATTGQLRTIRNGAVYTLIYQVTDNAGLTNTCQSRVSVSH